MSDSTIVSNITTHPPLGKSDHLVVTCKLVNSKRPQHSTRGGRRICCYDSADFSKINKAFQEVDWSAVSSSMDVNTAWSAWKSSFFSVVDQSVPSKCVHHVRPKNPWVTPMIERLIKDKCSAYRAVKRDKSSSSRAVFNQLRNRVTHLLRISARAHASALHRQLRLTPSSYSSSSFWQHMKRVTGKVKSSVVPDLIGPTFTASSAKEKAQLLNSLFTEQSNYISQVG